RRACALLREAPGHRGLAALCVLAAHQVICGALRLRLAACRPARHLRGSTPRIGGPALRWQ
ncbi:MAG: hypothetical protein ACXWOL_06545, partial [Ktedonobacteraceae bacterium]